MNIIEQLYQEKLIDPPKFCLDNLVLLSIVGSYSYGTSTDLSDQDLIGVVIPPKSYIYPQGLIHGYDNIPTFENYVNHHIPFQGKEYDITFYSIVKLFKLAENGNPNILDWILAPEDCVLVTSKIGKLIRDSAQQFMSKRSIPNYFGFSHNHITSMKNRIKSGVYPEKRKILYERFGYDCKDLAHSVRCLLSLKDMLLYGTYDVRKHAELIKQVRGGSLTFEQGEAIVVGLEEEIKRIKDTSTLRDEPDHNQIRNLLLQCLEIWEKEKWT
jgi:predicted nucleotidyltransferase